MREWVVINLEKETSKGMNRMHVYIGNGSGRLYVATYFHTDKWYLDHHVRSPYSVAYIPAGCAPRAVKRKIKEAYPLIALIEFD